MTVTENGKLGCRGHGIGVELVGCDAWRLEAKGKEYCRAGRGGR